MSDIVSQTAQGALLSVLSSVLAQLIKAQQQQVRAPVSFVCWSRR